MQLPLETAVATFAEAGGTEGRSERVEQRMADLQALLEADLDLVELTLARVADVGVEPATDAARHLVLRGGKRVRPLALLLSAACFGPIAPATRELAVVAELVHSATLLHDDVIDEGALRRGAPAARRIWGNAVSVLAGDLLLVHALSRTHEHAPALLPDLLVTLQRLVDGEVIQLRGRRRLDVSEVTYERILRDKTASLFAWATRTGAQLAGASEREAEGLGTFGERLGIAFQLVDDVLDYTANRGEKSALADLAEGKLTLPLVLAVRAAPDLEPLVRRIHEGELDLVELVRLRVLESGACEAVRARARDCTTRGLDALEQVRPSPARELLREVAVQLTERAG